MFIDFTTNENLYFGQQHIGTEKFFGENYHTVHIDNFPHMDYLNGHKKPYIEYLNHTWYYMGKYDREGFIKDKIKCFDILVEDILKNGIKEAIKIVRRFDRKIIICGGNHRAAIARYFDKIIPVNRINLFDRIKKTVQVDGKFGLRDTKKPYHSIYKFNNGKFIELIEGRRNDILDRIKLIDRNDIINKKILDIGCNIGSNSFLAAYLGAKKIVGIDSDPNLLNAAIRLNTLFSLPCYFKQIDLNKKVEIDKYDTAFIFSVDKHIKNHENITKIIKGNINVVYFETHENSNMPIDIKKNFSNISLIKTYLKRKLYKCIVKG